MKKFVDKRIGTNPIMPLSDPVKKKKLKTFKNINEVTTCKTKNSTYTFTTTYDVFSKLAIISQKSSINLKSLFSYPLRPLPMSLAAADGTLKNTKVDYST